jgi:hypothetical protein
MFKVSGPGVDPFATGSERHLAEDRLGLAFPFVTPAKTGAHTGPWVPAFAGMTLVIYRGR